MISELFLYIRLTTKTRINLDWLFGRRFKGFLEGCALYDAAVLVDYDCLRRQLLVA